ncbi:ChrR family anti-sigma-E factor [Allorhizobium taibaishanense]|uniref:Transcriptional regulator n=1 Tax=Allorhizobium taibaishanense TaxID=887144 RepID=A0A1Q9A853_9HYPH|nr:ChrR family anti-sigma-E factor [Allorhizobium taibaishanense]MBB4009755.1 putative transcriptional regulator [Allorhizobium taibaishanense]OLP50744.1 transcriptional regulator [Allorhizobium taibaishanense]
MSVHHHVSDELLLDYANGSLSEGWSIAVATHLALCPHCRKRLSAMEATAGAMIESLELEPAQASNADTSWQAMRARLEADKVGNKGQSVADKPASAAPNFAEVPVLPEPLRSYLGKDIDGLKWKPLGRGAYHIKIKTGDADTSVRLLRIPAGKPVPEHSHGGRELTLVLKGSFYDGQGRFARGDLEEADQDVEHQPIADEGEDCICLAVTDAPLRFKSRLVRLVQPILGI